MDVIQVKKKQFISVNWPLIRLYNTTAKQSPHFIVWI